uniref:Phospholipid/glycerol acyltransferase domain-containing protein n=1 Tax=Panagrolaimus sp. ES5 TaxID=591445 RepID=A0AC34FTD4_9BILA
MSRSTTSRNDEEESLLAPVMDFRKLMAMIITFYWFIMTVFIVPAACVSTCILVCPIMIFSMKYFNLIEHTLCNMVNEHWVASGQYTGLTVEDMKYFNLIEHTLCNMVNEHWVASGQYTGLTVEEYGDDITTVADKRALFLANHLGLVDHYCLMTAFQNKPSVAGKYMWVIFNIWKSTPLGIMWGAHGNFFINGGASKRAGVLQQFRDHLINNYWKFDYGWVVMYPEGSRLFLIKNSEKQFAEKNGIEPFKHCAHPRIGAAHSVLSVCGPSEKSLTKARVGGNNPPMEYIIDCTLGYPNGNVPGLGEAMLGEWHYSNVAIHYSIHKVKPEWSNEEVLKEWMYKQYEKKDKLLEDYYRTGKFPGQPRQISYSIFRNVLVQIFWITLFYAHYSIWIRPFGLYLSSFIY